MVEAGQGVNVIRRLLLLRLLLHFLQVRLCGGEFWDYGRPDRIH